MDSSKRSHISSISESQLSNSCRCSSSILKTLPPGLTNYWGYGPVSFFAPHLGYSTCNDPLVCLDEFRTMVKELHRAGIEVILDVVYNHTGEGDENGPTLCFRGLENSFYYMLEKDKARYANYTGAGNTLKANHSVVKRLILDSLRYWVSEMHVDGFRFDLASIFSRNESGEPMLNPPIVWEIDSDPVLAGTKLIAEAWDSGGLYQVGSFGQDKWKEWNGQFRDDVRSFVKGDPETVVKLRERIAGSRDLYRERNRPAAQSINFVTCHDGFTLNDLVSFDAKHNEANREANRDGTNNNHSWNCGVEGPTDSAAIHRLRMQQIRNLLALTLLSVGTPMLLMGDEVCRTQLGNNNAYCQDNATSWFDWSLCDTNADLLRFVRQLIHLRLHFDQKTAGAQTTLEDYLKKSRIEWHGVEIGKPDWGSNSHSLALSMHNFACTQVRYIAINAYWKPLEFELPFVTGAVHGGWLRLHGHFSSHSRRHCRRSGGLSRARFELQSQFPVHRHARLRPANRRRVQEQQSLEGMRMTVPGRCLSESGSLNRRFNDCVADSLSIVHSAFRPRLDSLARVDLQSV